MIKIQPITTDFEKVDNYKAIVPKQEKPTKKKRGRPKKNDVQSPV